MVRNIDAIIVLLNNNEPVVIISFNNLVHELKNHTVWFCSTKEWLQFDFIFPDQSLSFHNTPN